MGRTEISIMECTDRNFCVKVDETSFCGLLRKPKLGKIFVNDKLKLHNGVCHTNHYAKIMIHTLVAHFVTRPLIIRYEKKELIFKKRKNYLMF